MLNRRSWWCPVSAPSIGTQYSPRTGGGQDSTDKGVSSVLNSTCNTFPTPPSGDPWVLSEGSEGPIRTFFSTTYSKCIFSWWVTMSICSSLSYLRHGRKRNKIDHPGEKQVHLPHFYSASSSPTCCGHLPVLAQFLQSSTEQLASLERILSLPHVE